MVSAQRRTYIAGISLFTAAAVSFNGFVWQLNRRAWKQNVIESHNNMRLPPLKTIPPIGSSVKEFQPVELTGTLDNEGSVVVGPRPMPHKKDGVAPDETQRAGFLILTPFEEDGTGLVVMVNRGWVPIDAAKSRLHRVQYTGDAFKHITLRGVIRREESIDSWYYGTNTEANKGPSVGNAWLASRPFEAAQDYFRRRYGDRAAEIEEQKGLRHWMVEIIENHTGDDQRFIKGTVYPIRRTVDDLTHTSITPLVHSFYAGFWLMVSLMSLASMRVVMVGNRMQMKAHAARYAREQIDLSVQRAEQAAFNEQVQRVARSGGTASDLNLKTPSAAALSDKKIAP